MKRIVQHPAPSARELAGPRYWRSLDELAGTPGFQAQLEREFPEGAGSLEGVDRRHFVKIMAASFALGGLGLAGCRRPEKHILPYGKSVEYVVPGLPLYYATAMPLRRAAIPLVAETHQGRPTKLEGNPSYAPHGGTASLHAQASVLDLYDPDRAKQHVRHGRALTTAGVNDLLAGIGRTYAAAGGAGLAFLADESSSPTRLRLVAALRRRFPRAIWAEYEPVQDEPPVAAAQAAFGRAVKPLYRFEKAQRIVSLDADFLSAESGSLRYARSFAQGRRVHQAADPMNRLYVAESALTLTGMMADHRLRLASSHVLAFAAALAGRVMDGASPFAALAAGLDFPQRDEWLAECAQDLLAHRGRSLVVAGAHQPVAVHTIAHVLNAFLGNVGQTLDFVEPPTTGASTLPALAEAIKRGAVQTLVVINGNPAYNAPADLDLPGLLKSVPEVIRYGGYEDETSALAGTTLAATHYLESWGDARTVDGTVVPIQPMILPLFGGLMEVELLARLAGEENTDPYAQVFTTIAGLASGDPQKAFAKFLHDGLLEGSAFRPVPVAVDPAALGGVRLEAAAPVALSLHNLEVRFIADPKLDDGRFANNGWLQECPDPITRICWDNTILVSPRVAQALGIVPRSALNQVARKEAAEFSRGQEDARIFKLKVGPYEVEAPVHIQPGLANFTVVVSLGYGRTRTGRVGTGAGYNAYAVRTAGAPGFATGATLTVTGRRQYLANTQEHWSMEGRDIVREANHEEFQRNPAFAAAMGIESHSPPVYGDYTPAQFARLPREERIRLNTERANSTPRGNSLYEMPDFGGAGAAHRQETDDRRTLAGVHQWAMSIDLNTCIGCQACVVACQAENNIPIVGRDQVRRGREMHWIRIDRYYADGRADADAFGRGGGNTEIPEDPQVMLQPMTCLHCETAPCEIVCPVNATVHDEEGLNTMAYNRCIGTRYCANNCPYKVRRFNYFDYNKRSLDELYLGPLASQKQVPELLQMVKNPDVTVRMRGVMEKCTYCVQRIQQAKIAQKRQAGASGDVAVPDGAIKTACQQTCPVDAIVFGDLNDPKSAVSQLKSQEWDYSVLGYLNTRPRTTYLAKLRNPNPAMPDYQSLPLSRIEYKNKNYPPKAKGSNGGNH